MGRAAAVAVLSCIVLTAPGIVLAADPASPDTLEFCDVVVCRDLLEEDDFFVGVHYNILYDPTEEPSQTAQQLFTIRLLSADGETQLGAVQPYPYYNTGYDQGAAGLYFDADEALVWSTAYILQIAGNPAYYAAPPSVNHALAGDDYSGMDGQEDNQVALYTFIVATAEALETNWSTTLLERTDIGTVLDEVGQTYFSAAIPGLQSLCPQVYFIQALTMDYTERDWGTDMADTYAARYDGTFVGDGMSAIAGLFDVEPQLLGGIIFVLIPLLAVMVMCLRWFHDTTPALIAAPLIMACGALLGFFSMGVFAVAGLCCALFAGYVIFFRTS